MAAHLLISSKLLCLVTFVHNNHLKCSSYLFLGLLFIYKIFILYSAGELRQAIFASAHGGNSHQ